MNLKPVAVKISICAERPSRAKRAQREAQPAKRATRGTASPLSAAAIRTATTARRRRTRTGAERATSEASGEGVIARGINQLGVTFFRRRMRGISRENFREGCLISRNRCTFGEIDRQRCESAGTPELRRRQHTKQPAPCAYTSKADERQHNANKNPIKFESAAAVRRAERAGKF